MAIPDEWILTPAQLKKMADKRAERAAGWKAEREAAKGNNK